VPVAELTIPVGEGSLVVEVDDADVPVPPEGLALASNRGRIVATATVSLEEALDRLQPTVRALAERLRQAGPDEVTVEFGIKLGGETGLILAKGTAEVNFKVSMSWKADARA
jgi:hypothetical protein